ncbi:MAG: glycosyltransferase family 2 protein [Chitinophagaceae bacterium]
MAYGPTPLVSIITLHYNQLQATQEFLESSRFLTYPNYEIIVCDMHSDYNPEREIINRNYQNLRFYRSLDNLGFAGGNNWGLKKALGEFILFINNDTILSAGLIENLIQPMLNDPLIAGVSPKIRYSDEPSVIQYAGFTRMNMITGRAFTIGEGEEDNGQHAVSGPTWAVHGCAMFVRRTAIERVGMFAENFFLYYEEWDWSARVLRQGLRLWYAADALVYHKESASVGKVNPLKIYYHTRNRILFMRRNASNTQFFLFLLFFSIISFPKSAIFLLIKGRFRELQLFIKAMLWNLGNSSISPVFAA